MSILDRDWMHSSAKTGSPGSIDIVKGLVIINTVVFLIGFFLRGDGHTDFLEIWGCYSVYTVFDMGQIWRLITYQFLHANLGHIVLNMVALWFFGRPVERIFGPGKFLIFYLSCGVAAALFSSVLGYFGLWDAGTPGGMENAWKYIPMVGASGSIYGAIAACAVLFPDARVQLLFPPVDTSVRTFSLAILGIALAVIVMDWNNAGGEAGHMGGILMGFAIMGIRKLLHRSPVNNGSYAGQEPRASRMQSPSREEIDAILDKIGRQGLDSLTEHERNVLKQASQSKKY